MKTDKEVFLVSQVTQDPSRRLWVSRIYRTLKGLPNRLPLLGERAGVTGTATSANRHRKTEKGHAPHLIHGSSQGTLIGATRQFLALACATVVALAAQTRAATWYVSAPVTNASPYRFSAIGAGTGHSLAVETNGTVLAWGFNNYGQCQCDVPTNLAGATAVAGNDFISLALITNGTVVAWGYPGPNFGYTNVPRNLSNVVAIAAQKFNAMVLKSDGTVVTWIPAYPLTNMPAGLTNVVAIATGVNHDLAVKSDGTVVAWGNDTYRQTNVPADLSNVVAVAAGFAHSLALKSDGTVVAWGSYIGTNVPAGLSGVIAISAYQDNCAALKSDGTVVTWGTSQEVPSGLSNVVAIATGYLRYLALKSDGSLVTWGCYGQIEVPGTSITGGDIQGAVNQASDGDTVVLEPGWYELTNQIVITNGIVLRSAEGSDQTILNVTFTGYGLWVSNTAAVIDGLTLRGGVIDSCNSWADGRAIFLVGGTIQNCQFTNAHLVTMGTSVYMLGGLLTNSVISYGAFPGLFGSAIYCGAGGLVTDCRIVNDFGGLFPMNGEGIYLEQSQVRNSIISGALRVGQGSDGWAVNAHWSTIVGCTITPTRSGSGAFLDNSVMDRCIVAHNSNRGCSFDTGGGGIRESNSLIFNSLILSNGVSIAGPDCGDGQCGGGVFMIGGALANCTVVGNSASHGGGVYIKSGGLTNCVIYGNRIFPGANDWEIVGSALFDHCCTTPDPGGAGNIILDPQFVSPTTSDFHLLPGSLCNSAGVVQEWMAGAFDLDGNPRTTYGFVDIGAYQTLFATARDRAEGLIGAVSFLAQRGALSQQQAKGLIARVQTAERSMNAGRTGPACNQMDSFLNQVHLLIEAGALTPTLGQALENAANALKAALGCPLRATS
jgi:alpha-tubulin suppressor-like RCC1 family protein